MSVTIENIDWAMLRQQKEFLLNHGCDDAMGLAHLLDYIQDSAVKQGYNKIAVFGQDEQKAMRTINELLKDGYLILDHDDEKVTFCNCIDGEIGYYIQGRDVRKEFPHFFDNWSFHKRIDNPFV